MAEYRGRKDGLDPKNFLEVMESIPAFMTETPEGELPPLVEALQALKYAEDDPDQCAENYKLDGNMNFKKKNYKLSVDCYTKALELKMTKMDLKAALLFNRATANFQLGNYRRCVNDCKDAVSLDSGYVKARVKGAQALYALANYPEAMEWTKKGLELDETNLTLLALRTKVEADQKKYLAKHRKEEKEAHHISTLRSAIAQRGIRLSPANPWNGDHVARTPSGYSVSLTPESTLIWPVRILFPEVNQQDFVEQVDEGSEMGSVLGLLLEENCPEWDVNNAYSVGSCRLFFLDSSQTVLFEVGRDMALGKVLAHKEYVVENALPTFLVLSLSTVFSKSFLSRYEKVLSIH